MKTSPFLLLLVAIFLVSFITQANNQPILKTMRISIPLSDKMSYRYEKYILLAYNQLGYKVLFEQMIVARARELVDAGELDGMMIAEKEIDQVYSNLVRVPVVLAKGALMLYCNKAVVCELSVLDDASNIVGVISGNSMSANFMRSKQASIYALKSNENLGAMLTKERLNYVMLVDEDQLGNLGELDDTQFNKVEVYRTEGYHFINIKHKHILPELTQAMQNALDKYGYLVDTQK